MEEMTVAEAKSQGAMGLFESKYGEGVRCTPWAPTPRKSAAARTPTTPASWSPLRHQGRGFLAGVRRIKATIGRKAE
ncbi:MAG: hypothetical protein V8Q82_06860 [Christensenellales bacterium]